MTLWLMLLAGFVLLMVGGEILVRGSVDAARKLGVSPLLIGLTLVGFGTSMPEMVTSVQATYAGSPGIAIGNIVGSNISNILLILGASAIVTPLVVARQSLMRDGTAVLVVTLAFCAISLTMPLSLLVGVMFLLTLAGYLFAVALIDRNSMAAQFASGEIEDERGSLGSAALSALLAVAGMAVVIFGAHLLVEAAIEIARIYSVPEDVIGLTVVALGTSLPELATSLAAAFKREADLAVGNILGSNLFNLLSIGGVTAVLAPSPIPVPEHIAQIDNFVMLATVVLVFIIAGGKRNISRLEGTGMFLAYCVYIYWLAAPQFAAAT